MLWSYDNKYVENYQNCAKTLWDDSGSQQTGLIAGWRKIKGYLLPTECFCLKISFFLSVCMLMWGPNRIMKTLEYAHIPSLWPQMHMAGLLAVWSYFFPWYLWSTRKSFILLNWSASFKIDYNLQMFVKLSETWFASRCFSISNYSKCINFEKSTFINYETLF